VGVALRQSNHLREPGDTILDRFGPLACTAVQQEFAANLLKGHHIRYGKYELDPEIEIDKP
jgi:hypothetical protein